MHSSKYDAQLYASTTTDTSRGAAADAGTGTRRPAGKGRLAVGRLQRREIRRRRVRQNRLRPNQRRPYFLPLERRAARLESRALGKGRPRRRVRVRLGRRGGRMGRRKVRLDGRKPQQPRHDEHPLRLPRLGCRRLEAREGARLLRRLGGREEAERNRERVGADERRRKTSRRRPQARRRVGVAADYRNGRRRCLVVT